jgi:hypothetical protein
LYDSLEEKIIGVSLKTGGEKIAGFRRRADKAAAVGLRAVAA